MEWSNKMTTTLIEDYHNSPELWNNKISEYKDNKIKTDTFKELANKFKCTVPEIKNKIKNLRSAYHRERKRMQSKKSGSSSQKKSKWFAFELLSFISDVDLQKSTFSTAGSEDEDFQKEERVDSQHAQEVDESRKMHEVINKRDRNSCEECDKCIAPKKKRKSDSPSDQEKDSPSNIKKSCEKDDCSVYGEYVANELRSLNPRARTIVKHIINNTLFEAAMGKYDAESASSRASTPFQSY